jgi:ArsR family transcriptional regulator
MSDLLVFKNQKEAFMTETEFMSVRLFKALGNPLRRKILDELLVSPAHPERLARRTGRVLCAVSRALGILASAGLVKYRTEGHGVLYAVKHPEIESLLRLAEEFVRRFGVPVQVQTPVPAENDIRSLYLAGPRPNPRGGGLCPPRLRRQ